MRMESVRREQVDSRWRADRAWRLLVLAPFAEALILPLLASRFIETLASRPPEIVGIPFGIVLNVLILGWAALGARVVWTTTSLPMASLALATTTIPALLLLPITPALILIAQNI